MSDTIAKDRSPRSPSSTLEESINQVRRLFDQVRTSTVKPELAAKALGYSGANGAAMTTLATLAQYGLVDRSGGDVSITPLAIKILHPTGQEQLQLAIHDAALAPKVLNDLYNGFFDCSAEVIAGQLIQNGFNPDKAKRVASIHASNKAFAKLTNPSIIEIEEAETDDTAKKTVTPPPLEGVRTESKPVASSGHTTVATPTGHKMLAQYQIPLGANEATLVFTGQQLTADDFDALVDFVHFSKKQFERAQRNTSTIPVSPARSFPAQAIWKNKDHDAPVTIVSEMGEHSGVKFFQSSMGTGIPGNELTFG